VNIGGMVAMVGASYMGKKENKLKWLLKPNKISNSTTKQATMLLLSDVAGSAELIQRWEHLFSIGNVNIGGKTAIVHAIRLIVGSLFWNPHDIVPSRPSIYKILANRRQHRLRRSILYNIDLQQAVRTID
jgi:hypothetical protein